MLLYLYLYVRISRVVTDYVQNSDRLYSWLPSKFGDKVLFVSLNERVNRHYSQSYQSVSSSFIYTVSQKNCANLFFLSELCQISTDCGKFWHKDSKENKFFYGVLIFHLT